jgi:hypothetical protein
MSNVSFGVPPTKVDVAVAVVVTVEVRVRVVGYGKKIV